jgi:hypothetical protein
MRCTSSSCTAIFPPPVAEPALAPALPHRSRARPNRVRSLPASHLAYNARVRPPPGTPHAGSCCPRASPRQTAAPELHPHAPVLHAPLVPSPLQCRLVLCPHAASTAPAARPFLCCASSRTPPSVAAWARPACTPQLPRCRPARLLHASRAPEPLAPPCAAPAPAPAGSASAPPACFSACPRCCLRAPLHPRLLTLPPPAARLEPPARAAACAEEEKQGERKEKEHLDGAAGEEKKRGARIRESREEGQMEFPKGLCAILENCRDLFVKHKFPINLKP